MHIIYDLHVRLNERTDRHSTAVGSTSNVQAAYHALRLDVWRPHAAAAAVQQAAQPLRAVSNQMRHQILLKMMMGMSLFLAHDDDDDDEVVSCSVSNMNSHM